MRTTLKNMLTNPQARSFVVANDILALVTLISVAGIVLETMPALSEYGAAFLWIEYVTVFIFTIEYILRTAVARPKRKYVWSFFGIVDLLAIVPTFLGLANLTFLKTARVLRILRFLRMVRLAKLVRVKRAGGSDVEEHQRIFRLNLQIYFFALFASIIIFGTLMYIAEGGSAAFASIPHGMLWATQTILGGISGSTVGAFPATTFGIIVTFLARFAGLALFGMLIAVVGNTLKQYLLGSEKAGE